VKIIPAAFASLALLANAWAARDADFSEFKGTYRGSGTIVAYGYSYPLTAAVKFAVAKSGKTAKATLSGEISAMGIVPWATTIRLQRKRKASTNSLLGVGLDEGTFAGKGKYRIPNASKLVSKTHRAVTPGFVIAQKLTMIVEPKGRKRKKLKTTLTVTFNGTPTYVYNLSLTGK